MIRETMDDRRLLDRYLATRDEGAFRELVGRHLDFVHAVARRVTGNDELARDAAQAVFVKLARDAAKVPRGLSLEAWLHRTCRCMAIDLVRSEDRRRKREQLAHHSAPMNPPPEPAWERLAPLIDEAVDSLPAADRELVLAKYYRNESFAAIAARLGWTEANARKRASRSLEKIRHLLARRGFTTTAATLATVLPAHAVAPAPASLAGAVVAAAAEIAPTPAFGLHFAMTTTQKSTATAAAAALALLASGWAGHALGSARKVRGETAPPQMARTDSGDRTTGLLRETEDPLHAFRELVAGRRERPWQVVSRIPAARVPEFLAELRQSFGQYPSQSAEGSWRMEIESALLYRWAEADPRAALEDARSQSESRDVLFRMRNQELVRSVLSAWMQVDPESAYCAAKEKGSFGHLAAEMLVRTWTLETLESDLSPLGIEGGSLLGVFCKAIQSDDRKREAMLAHIEHEPKTPRRDRLEHQLFRAWGYRDFNAAIEKASLMGFHGTVNQLLEDNLNVMPARAMPWAVEQGIPPDASKWGEHFAGWLRTDAGAARSWLAGQLDSWEDEGHRQAAVELVARDLLHLKSQLDPDTALLEETSVQLKARVARWAAVDPPASERWIAGTPEVVRQLLENH